MLALYFMFFCLVNAFIIFWCFRYDDKDEYEGQKRDKRFTPVKKEKTEMDKS
ncbi:hypothetical protein [Kordiimonas laminariae]|uniref:hypothetical protein n=1 Tax=Kordiimonas laminariae TaxID=2917717 RepID=UPI001FF3EEE0|nr:hypothetical protein [Kordiimonas laminariae]MCK0070446.1 hypothetical protein [Kordiimonas laminariae]